MVSSTIEVTGLSGNGPALLEVQENIVHWDRSDPTVHLVAPDGTPYLLRSNSLGSSGPTTHSVDVSSKKANGTWKLTVQDRYSTSAGYLDSWKLSF
ncbi:proprotein convertase P-domain-containing protein [Streptomyces sp. NPDC051018]|uniref:proprotein convertase P-domain-containing protein n=1 Tax=Streptomyces sp. NPDC051018 TaxID=3365639 RepID=UPI0037A3E92F